jgi:hypothetical protein
VLLGPRGDVQAAWRTHRGPGGFWLHLITGADHDAGEAVAAGIRAVQAHATNSPRPIYTAVMGHEARLNLALREAGFEPVGHRFRLVKHTTVRVLEPNWTPAAVRERRLEATNPASSMRVRAIHGAEQVDVH